MTETVTNTNERKSLFSSFLEVLEAKDKQVLAERQLEEEKYQRRTQRIYDFYERQRREAAELRRCVQFVSQHAHALETALRGGGEGVPLGAALLRQAAALQRCMAQCVANATRIRHLLAAAHRPQMDTMLAKMEAELSAWTAFLQRAVDATYSTEIAIDNLHNMIAEQRRYVREVSASPVLAALCAPGQAVDAGDDTPPARERALCTASSTPIAQE
ncbi:uncharacterized protein [Battus philenor]|uniref:uncharacterized protein n=1 Tax=Battus philenor TaxID=42288 RepID=UPI0035D003EC